MFVRPKLESILLKDINRLSDTGVSLKHTLLNPPQDAEGLETLNSYK